MSKKLFYASACTALMIFSSFTQNETVEEENDVKTEETQVLVHGETVEEESETEKEETQVLVQNDSEEEEILAEQTDEQLACECKKRKKGKQEASLRFVSTNAIQNNEEAVEETVEEEVLA